MSKFKKKGSGELPKISTASLPDIVFMLLFFFMVATVLRDNTLMIQNTLPAADQIQKLDKKVKDKLKEKLSVIKLMYPMKLSEAEPNKTS